ncbi:MAG: DUF3489 domain-containing protein [Pseudomonadota bacterium]
MTDSQVHNIENTCKGFHPPIDQTGRKKQTKTDRLLKLLASKRGATIEQLQEASGWQAHSIRGFLSGTVKKRLGLAVENEPDKNGVRRYRIVETTDAPTGN